MKALQSLQSSVPNKSLHEAWEQSNRLALNLMRMTMAANVNPFMPKTDNARKFMKLFKDCSQSDIIDKSIVGNLSSELTNKKFDWSQPIHDHVTEMANLVENLNSLGMQVSESFLV